MPSRRRALRESAASTRAAALHDEAAAPHDRPPPRAEIASVAPPPEFPSTWPPSAPPSLPPTQAPALQVRPEPGAPQSPSAAQPQVPESARHAGLSLVQLDRWVGEHSVQAPARAPLVWHAGLIGLGHERGAPEPLSPAHGAQVLPSGSHTGRCTSLQSASVAHATQLPVSGSQRGVLPPQRDRSLGVHCTQRPASGAASAQKDPLAQWAHWPSVEHASHTAFALQTGLGLAHGALALQLAQLCAVRSQASVAQSAPLRQATQVPVATSQ